MARLVGDPQRGVRVVDGVVELPPVLADRAWDIGFQTGGESVCEALARHARGAVRLQLEAASATTCRWTRREVAPDGRGDG